MPPRRASSPRPSTGHTPPGTYFPISPAKYQATVRPRSGGGPSRARTRCQHVAIQAMAATAHPRPAAIQPHWAPATSPRTCPHCSVIRATTKARHTAAMPAPTTTGSASARARRGDAAGGAAVRAGGGAGGAGAGDSGTIGPILTDAGPGPGIGAPVGEPGVTGSGPGGEQMVARSPGAYATPSAVVAR